MTRAPSLRERTLHLQPLDRWINQFNFLCRAFGLLGSVPGAAVQFASVQDHRAVRPGVCLCRDYHGQYFQNVSVILPRGVQRDVVVTGSPGMPWAQTASWN